MNLRPKTKRRLLILAAGGVFFGTATSLFVYFRLNGEENRQKELRDDGLGAYQRGDFGTAVADFKQYITTDRMDSEAIYAYAVSRSKVPLPDLEHLREAKSLFSRYLELKPGDLQAEHQLLDIYHRLHYAPEADGLADSLLARNPDDVPALQMKLSELVDKANYPVALPLSERINQLDPLDLRTQETTYDLMLRCNRTPADLIDRADRMLKAHPSDPRFELLRADAALCGGNPDGARRWLRTAATRPMPDAQTLQLLTGAMDRMGMWTDARALLEKTAAASTAPTAVTAAWVLRLWEGGQIDQALDNLKSVAADHHADSRLLGIKAMILFGRSSTAPGKSPDADALADLKDLDQRVDDISAAAWSSLLHADFVEGVKDPMKAAAYCDSASRQDPDNAVARFDEGRAYLRLGESDLALKCFGQAIELAPGWSGPFVVMARTLLERGQIVDAQAPAQAAFDRDPSSSAAQTTLAITATAQPNPPDLNRLLAWVKGIFANNPDDLHVLCSYADLLARAGHRPEATDLILKTIASPNVGAGTLCDLLAVSNANHLDLTDAITDRATHHLPATPAGLRDQVRLFTASGRAVDASRAIRGVSNHTSPDWKIAVLQSREMCGETNFAPDWAAVVDANPDNLDIQHAALDSPVAWTDRSLIDRTIVRCKMLTGADAVQWRLARARWQLASNVNVKTNAAAAATSMDEVARLVPRMLEPRLIWADALERLGDTNSAIAQMRIAWSIARTPAVTIELADLLASVGQYHEAVEQVDSVTNTPAAAAVLSPHVREQAVRIFCQAGELKKASTLLENSPGDHSVDQDLRLAHIYSDQGDDVSASHVYSQLMQASTPQNSVIRAFSWFQASRGNIAEARETLKRLDPALAAPGEIQRTNADFEAAFGTTQAAIATYQSATAEAPTNVQTWLALAGFDLRSHDFSAAAAAADQGLKWSAGDASLTAMGARARTLSKISPASDLQPLINLLSIEPTSATGTAMVGELAASGAAKESPAQLLNRLAAIAQRDPRCLPAQLLLASRYADAGLYDDAVLTATHAGDLFPTAAEPAQLLARIAAATNRWEAALAAATDWRDRSLAHPQPADNAIAIDQEQLGHPESAIEILSPFLPRSTPAVQASPGTASDDSTTVAAYARALALQGHYTEAQALLAPLCAQSIGWRRQALQIIADTAPDAASVNSQISQIEAMIPAGSVDDHVALADARCTAGTRLSDAPLLQRALDGLTALTDAGVAPVDAWLLLGEVDQQLNQLPDAEKAYRKALSLSPNLPLAQNNLAMVILLKNGDLKEARALAQQAVTTAPADSAVHGTLGEIEAHTGDVDAARAQLETAIRLDPQNTAALVALADMQCQAAQTDKALQTVRRVDNITQITHKPLDANVKQQLNRVRDACKRASAMG